MSIVHAEDMVKHGIERLQASVADLIDSSQSLARSALVDAAEAFQHGREQAGDVAHDALRYSRDRARRGYGEVEAMASRDPLMAIAIGVGIGMVVGFLLHAITPKPAPAVQAPEAVPAPEETRLAATARTRARPAAKKAPAATDNDAPRPARRRRTPAAKASLQ